MTGPQPRRLYLLVILLHLVGDVALSPFYPQLFERLFGVTDPAATGAYIWVCRAAALAAMPLWGVAARWVPVRVLVVGGLAAAAVLELALAASPSYAAFLAVSVAHVSVTMVFALAYPAFVGAGRDRVRDVTLFAYVVNGGIVAATLLGAAVMALPDPRAGIAACSLLYAALAVLCHRHLPREAAPGARGRGADPARGTAAGTAGPGRSHGARGAAAAVAAVCAAVLAVETARLVVRPFFTLYAEQGGVGTTAAAVLFLLPQVAVLCVLPLAGRAHALLGRALLPAACLVAALGLLWQFASPDPVQLALGRVVFGAGLGLGHVALDLRVFAVTGASGPAFSAVATTRVGATLVSPVLATGLAGYGAGLPLAAGAALLGVLALVLAALPGSPARAGGASASAPAAPSPAAGPRDPAASAGPAAPAPDTAVPPSTPTSRTTTPPTTAPTAHGTEDTRHA